MATSAVFPTVPARAGSYESFYLRAVSPDEPLGVWIRHTVHKPPGKPASGSVWCTVFDGRAGAPVQHKITTHELRAPAEGWIANGALGGGGRRFRRGGLAARGLRVAESASRCELELPGERGLRATARVEVPQGSAAGWRYSDPAGDSEHDVVNCSIASLALSATLPGESAARSLRTEHGGAYELGMREHDHGVKIAPFPDG